MRFVALSRPAARLALGAVLVTPLVIAPPAEAAAAPKVRFVLAHFDSPGSDRGGNKSVNGEYVVIKNTTRKPIKLKNWFLRDAAGFTYTFGNVTLKAGKRLTIRSGRGRDTSGTLYWGRKWYVWNNDKDTASLYNAARRKVDSCSWKVSASTGPDRVSCA